MSSSAKGLVGRYAGALYDLAVEAEATDSVLSDLSSLGQLINNNHEIAQLIASPVYARKEQASAMAAILKKAGFHMLTVKFVGVIAQNRRLFALPQMIQAYIDETARRNGLISAEIISAIALDEERTKSVESIVAELAGSKNISLEMRVDPSLIGGLIVRIGSRLIDASLKTKLNRLEAAMKGSA